MRRWMTRTRLVKKLHAMKDFQWDFLARGSECAGRSAGISGAQRIDMESLKLKVLKVSRLGGEDIKSRDRYHLQRTPKKG